MNVFPNPFNPATRIEFSSGRSGDARLVVYDLLGKRLATLFEGTMDPGSLYHVLFDGSHIPSGTYIVKIVQGEHQRTRRLVLLR